MKTKSAWLVIACLSACILTACQKEGKPPTDQTADKNAAVVSKQGSSEPEPDYAKKSVDENVKLADAYMQKKEYDKAERALLAALRQVENYKGQEGRQATILNNLAAVYEAKEMYPQCIPLLNKAQKLFIRAYGRKFQGVYITLGNMGRVLGKEHNWRDAAQVYHTAVDLMEQAKETKSDTYKTMLKNEFDAWKKARNDHKAGQVQEKMNKPRIDSQKFKPSRAQSHLSG